MKTRITCLVAVLASVVAGQAAADTITFVGEGKVGIVQIHSPNLGNLWVYAGELEWMRTSDNSFFYTYCVDANNFVQTTQTVVERPQTALTNPGVPDAGGKAAWLIDTYAPGIRSSGSNDDAAALQVAIWAALYDVGPTLNSGPFTLISASGAITQEAQNYLTSLYGAPGGGYYTAAASWFDSPSGHGQDQMPIAPVPEPGSLVLLGSTLAAWAAVRFRRRSARHLPSRLPPPGKR